MGIHYERGQALFALERYDEAIAEYRQELACNPQCAASRANIAASLVNLKRYSDAKAAVRDVLGLAPDYAYAFYVLSFVESNTGRDSPAQKAIAEALRLQPTARHFCRLGWLLRAQGRNAECLQATADALALDARHQESLVLRAKALDALGSHDEAAALLRSALEIDPEDPDAHQTLGIVALANGDAAEALDALREARRIDPVEHHDRDRILDAYARRFGPFRRIDALAKRFHRLSPLRRWAIDAAALSALVALFVATNPMPRDSSPLTTIVYFLAANVLIFIRNARHYPAVLVRLLRRRELDLRWKTVIAANFRGAVGLAFYHLMGSLAAIWLSIVPFLTFFVLGCALAIRRIEEARRIVGGEVSPLALIPLLWTLVLGVCFHSYLEDEQPLAAGICWAVVLATTGAAAWVLTWLKRRRTASVIS